MISSTFRSIRPKSSSLLFRFYSVLDNTSPLTSVVTDGGDDIVSQKSELSYIKRIASCYNKKNLKKATQILQSMEKEKHGKTVDAYNALFPTIISNKKSPLVFKTLKYMLNEEKIPISSEQSINDKGELENKNKVVSKIYPNEKTFEIITEHFSKGRSWKEVLNILYEMKRYKIIPTFDVFKHSLVACSSMGKWEKGFQVLDDMQAIGLKPNLWNVNAVIVACERGVYI